VATVFLKLLKSQESGYSGDKPDQRGKYILIPQKALSLFPPLSKQRLNDQSAIICDTLSGASIAVNLVYHNAKFFEHLGLIRDHNEVRLYRNSALDKQLNLDRYVVVGFLHDKKAGRYKAFSITPQDKNYEVWKKIAAAQKLHELKELPTISPLSDVLNQKESKVESIINQKEIFNTVANNATKQRKQQPGLADDPALVLSTLIKSQKDYSNYLRQIYGGKCALRGTALINKSFLGLDAAHIQPDKHKGPLLPTNGMLLSKDLHHALEMGAFTLDENNKVLVHPKIPTGSNLKEFAGNIVCPIPEFEIFKPFSGYVKYHKSTFYDHY